MDIITANESHIDFISDSLSTFYSEANAFVGYPKYKEDRDTMYKHVSKRVADSNSQFMYFVAMQDTVPAGFINLMVNEYNVGSILVVIGDSKECKEELITFGVNYLKNMNVNGIYSEVFEYDKENLEIFEEMGIDKQLINFKLK